MARRCVTHSDSDLCSSAELCSGATVSCSFCTTIVAYISPTAWAAKLKGLNVFSLIGTGYLTRKSDRARKRAKLNPIIRRDQASVLRPVQAFQWHQILLGPTTFDELYLIRCIQFPQKKKIDASKDGDNGIC